MRLFVILSFFLITILGFGQESVSNEEVALTSEDAIHLNWFKNLDEAKEVAKKTKKPILVYFTGSDWCTPCKKLEKYFFHTPEFEKASQNYHLVYLDSPYRDDIIPEADKKVNKKLADAFNANYPTIIALDYRGSERNRVERFSGEDPRYHWRFMDENKAIFRL